MCRAGTPEVAAVAAWECTQVLECLGKVPAETPKLRPLLSSVTGVGWMIVEERLNVFRFSHNQSGFDVPPFLPV